MRRKWLYIHWWLCNPKSTSWKNCENRYIKFLYCFPVQKFYSAIKVFWFFSTVCGLLFRSYFNWFNAQDMQGVGMSRFLILSKLDVTTQKIKYEELLGSNQLLGEHRWPVWLSVIPWQVRGQTGNNFKWGTGLFTQDKLNNFDIFIKML